jgi:hypothetical protein
MDVLQSGFEALVDGMYNRNKLDDRVETSWVISRVPPRCKNIKKIGVALSFQILDETKERRNRKFEKSNTRPNRLILYSRMKFVLDDEMGEILPPVQLSPPTRRCSPWRSFLQIVTPQGTAADHQCFVAAHHVQDSFQYEAPRYNLHTRTIQNDPLMLN